MNLRKIILIAISLLVFLLIIIVSALSLIGLQTQSINDTQNNGDHQFNTLYNNPDYNVTKK